MFLKRFLITGSSRVLSALGMLAVAAMLVHTVVEVVSRTGFNKPMAGTLEIVTFWYLPIIAFVGMWAGFRENEHISVDLLVTRLRPGAQWVMHIFVSTLVLVALGLMVWFTTQQAFTSLRINEYVGIDHVPIWPVRFVVPAALLAFAIALASDTVRIIRRGSLSTLEENDEHV
jgi:TRAP-type C4-dicarboxylate transport system permease small subunit